MEDIISYRDGMAIREGSLKQLRFKASVQKIPKVKLYVKIYGYILISRWVTKQECQVSLPHSETKKN